MTGTELGGANTAFAYGGLRPASIDEGSTCCSSGLWHRPFTRAVLGSLDEVDSKPAPNIAGGMLDANRPEVRPTARASPVQAFGSMSGNFAFSTGRPELCAQHRLGVPVPNVREALIGNSCVSRRDIPMWRRCLSRRRGWATCLTGPCRPGFRPPPSFRLSVDFRAAMTGHRAHYPQALYIIDTRLDYLIWAQPGAHCPRPMQGHGRAMRLRALPAGRQGLPAAPASAAEWRPLPRVGRPLGFRRIARHRPGRAMRPGSDSRTLQRACVGGKVTWHCCMPLRFQMTVRHHHAELGVRDVARRSP